MDYPTFVSSSSSKKEGNANGRSSPSYNLSRFSSQTMQEQGHFKSDVWSSSHASPLSNEFSPRKEESTYTEKPNETERRGDFSDFSKSTEAPVCISEFHFSIYKWPQYEIPVVIPLHQRIKLRSKDKDKPNKSYSSKGRANEDTVSESLPTLTSNISVNSKYSKMPFEELEEANTLSKEETFRFPKEEVISQPPEALISRRNINESDDTVFSNKKEATVFTEEVQKPELKRVHSIIHDQINQQGTMCFNLEFKQNKSEINLKVILLCAGGDITGKAEGKDNVAKTAKISNLNIGASKVVKEYEVKKISSHKKEVKKAISSHKTEVKEARSHGSPKNETENLKKGGARGEVKEFAKFFTQESISKKRNNSEARTQSCRWEGNITGTAVNDVSVAHASTFEMDTELHLPDASKLPDASFEVITNNNFIFINIPFRTIWFHIFLL